MKELIKKMYYKDQKSMDEISKELSISYQEVKDILKKYKTSQQIHRDSVFYRFLTDRGDFNID